MISEPTTKPSTYTPTKKGRSRNWSGSDLTTLNHYTTNNCTYDCRTIRFLSNFHCEDRATGEFETIRNSCDLSNVKCYKKFKRQKITIECLGTCPCLSYNGKERNLANFYHKKEKARNLSGSNSPTQNHNTTTTDKNCTKACHYISRPVCGSNGETYHNACMLENAACINPEQNIKVDCEGKCPCKHQSKRPCSSVCPLMFKPVCGSNGETYSNYCLLVYAACINPEQNIRVKCQKKCPCSLPWGKSGSLQDCDRGCPKTLKPVCGSNGETYDNDCLLEIAACENPEQNITMECEGKCPCIHYCTGLCPAILEPVCGSNGETYPNACMLENADCSNPEQNITVECRKKCPCKNCPLACPAILRPVCGSNGETYGNDCDLERAACENSEHNITMECEGKCPCHPKGTSTEHSHSKKGVGRSGSLQDCDHGCPKILKPVCGSNGETYSNDCFLEVAACENPEQNITVACDKKCPCQSKGSSTEHPDCKHLSCHWLYDPVCGTDGQNYPNSGCLDLAACENPSQNITLGCKGECPCDDLMSTTTHKSEIKSTLKDNEKCLTPCPEVNDPVCGSNGEVYGNSCLLGAVACQNPEKNITEDCKGECPCHNSTTPIHSDKARWMDEILDDKNSTIIHITSVPSVTNIPELQPNENFTDKVEYNCTFYAVCQESDINNKIVCGTDGETYKNKCELEIANCELQVDSLSHSSEEMSIELKCMGKCSECMDDEDTTKVGL